MANKPLESIVRLENEEEEEEDDIYDRFFAAKIFRIASILRIDFREKGTKWIINAIVTFVLFCLGIYTVIFNITITFSDNPRSSELSGQLLIVLWAIQSLISLVFLIYWQINGHFGEFRKKLAKCQGLRGLVTERGQWTMRHTNFYFHVQLILICTITFVLAMKFHLEEKHGELAGRQSFMFFYPELRPLYTIITTYLYIIWNMTLFVLILYTNATFLEMRFFNDEIENFDGSTESVASDLIEHLRVYSDLCGVIRQLDLIFRLYTFIMIVITIPSMIFTLMMMNHRIHSILDLLICLPTVGLCAFSFFSVTIAPARLHDEITRTKGCFCQNKSIWFPYRKEVYPIANILLSHMEQLDLGVSVWGFAVLSRPLILGTLSATAMMLSLLTELAPKSDLLHG